MRTGQFNRRTPRNVVGANVRQSKDSFNKAHKKETKADPPQFASSQVEEHRRFSETRDSRPNHSSSSSSSQNSRSSSRGSGSRTNVQSMTKGFVRSVVGMTAGAVMVTNSYTTMVEARDLERAMAADQAAAIVEEMDVADTEATEQDQSLDNGTGEESGNNDLATEMEQAPTETPSEAPSEVPSEALSEVPSEALSETPSEAATEAATQAPAEQPTEAAGGESADPETRWTWSEDGTGASIWIEGVGDVEATVTKTTQKEATCTEDGILLYTATAEANGVTYTDTKTDTIPATGHSFEGTIQEGNSIVYRCTGCGLEFSIGMDIDREE